MVPIDPEPEGDDDFLLVFPSELTEQNTPPSSRTAVAGNVTSKVPLVQNPVVHADRWRVVAAHAFGAVSAHRQAIRMSVALVGSAALGSGTTFMVMSRTPTEPTRAVETTSRPSPEPSDQVPVPISVRSAPTPVAAAMPPSQLVPAPAPAAPPASPPLATAVSAARPASPPAATAAPAARSARPPVATPTPSARPASPPVTTPTPAAQPVGSLVATRVPPAALELSKPVSPPVAPTAPPVVQRVAASTLPTPSPGIPAAAGSPRGEAVAVNASTQVPPPRADRRASPLPALRGVLIVTSSPAGAQVYVNGVLSGVTPLRLQDLAAGSRAVRVELEGYERWSTALRIVANERTTAVAELRPLAGR
jgi:hypothetical protein